MMRRLELKRRLPVTETLCGLLFLAVLLLSGGLFAESYEVYSKQLNCRIGYHLFSESGSWIESRNKMVEDDVFLRNNSTYYSTNVGSTSSSSRSGMPQVSFEYLTGIKINGFKGFRFGTALTFYTFSASEQEYYNGVIVYRDYEPLADPAVLSYNGKITISEKHMILAPSLNFYYFHEKGLMDILTPYAGIELGLGILNGERRLTMKTDLLSLAGHTYQADAAIQESYFNAMSMRLGITTGTQINITGQHFVDVRIGYIYQETSVPLTRSGTWNESRDGSSTSRKLREETKTVTYSQTGLYFNIGYSVGLL